MAVKKINEILESYRELYSESAGEKDIEFLEDITDTLNDYEERVSDSTNWKEKYETNDAEWRKKYTDRFFNSGNENNFEKNENEEEGKPLSYDSLFKEC